MKYFFVIIFALLLLNPELIAQKSRKGESKDAADVRSALQSWVRAIENRDRTAMEEISAPDHTYSGADGKIYSREENFKSLLNPEFVIESVKTSDVKVRVYNGIAAIVTGRATSKQKSGEETSVARTRFTQTWIKMDGRWKLAAEQSTKISGPKIKKRKK